MPTSPYNSNPNTQPTGNLTMTGQAAANVAALPTQAAPLSPNAPSGHSAAYLQANPQFNQTAGQLATNPPQAAGVTPENINTGQPSPLTVNATAGLPGSPTTSAPDANGNYNIDLNKVPKGPSSPYQQGFEQTKASGAAVPTTAGGANSTIQNTVGNTTEPASPLTSIVDTDTTFDNIFKQFDDFYSPAKQKQSLLEEYKSMESALGINAMNAELLNSKRIIEGTEDDIRSEVQAVSGFATDSQVMALSNARNKSLMKNYNYLLESRDSAMTQLSTMMNLSIKDREIATQEFDTKMNFAFKVKEFQQRATDNAREGYNNQIKLSGADGLYNSLLATGDPSAMAVVEKTMGFTPGGLKTAAAQAVKDRANQATMDALDIESKKSSIETDKAQRANIYSQISERNKPASAKPPTQAQLKVAGYKDRLVESNQIINGLGGQFTSGTSYVNKFLGNWSPNVLKGDARQQYEQAQRNFINAVLRQESGAAIGKDEFKNAEKQYFPQPGDSQAVQAQKANNRRTVIHSFTREAGEEVSSNIVTAPDGQEIEIID